MEQYLRRWRRVIEDFLVANTKQFLNKDIRIIDIGLGGSTATLKRGFPQLEIMDYVQQNGVHVVDICKEIPEQMQQQYDIVCCCEVLEHVKDPFKAAYNTMVLAKPGGTVLVTVPCMIYYHPMMPLCGDYWRFFASSFPLLFTYKSNIIQKTDHYFDPQRNQQMPIGATAIIRKEA